MLIYMFQAILRHLEETRLFIYKLVETPTLKDFIDENIISPDPLIYCVPVKNGRPLGEIILHMIRSIEYYMKGIVINEWTPLTYTIMEFNTSQEIVYLFDHVVEKAKKHLNNITNEMLKEQIDEFNRSASRGEILLEMLEHSIHHRGQLSVYFRLLEIDPPSIPYII
jgi:uncharacterized damage-inducible protein DinB